VIVSGKSLVIWDQNFFLFSFFRLKPQPNHLVPTLRLRVVSTINDHLRECHTLLPAMRAHIISLTHARARARERERYRGSEREKVRDKHTHKHKYTHVPVRHQTARPALETQCILCYRENVLDRNRAERGEREGVEKRGSSESERLGEKSEGRNKEHGDLNAK